MNYAIYTLITLPFYFALGGFLGYKLATANWSLIKFMTVAFVLWALLTLSFIFVLSPKADS